MCGKVVHVLGCYVKDHWIVLSGRCVEILKILLFCRESPFHQRRRGLSCVVQALGRGGAQAAPVWDAAPLVVVIPRHRPAAQDVLKGSEDGSCKGKQK